MKRGWVYDGAKVDEKEREGVLECGVSVREESGMRGREDREGNMGKSKCKYKSVRSGSREEEGVS